MENNNYYNTFPKRLRKLLDELRITQKDLAENVGVSRQVISSYCLGTTSPNIDTLCSIAKYLEVSSDYLLGLSDTPATDIDDKAITEKTGLSYDAVNNLNNVKEYTDSEIDGLADDSRKILKILNFILSDSKDGLQFLLEIARYLFVDYELENESNEIILIDKITKRKTAIKVSDFKQSLLHGISSQLQEWEKK